MNDENKMVRKQILKRLQPRPGGGACVVCCVQRSSWEQPADRCAEQAPGAGSRAAKFIRALRAFSSLPPKFVSRVFDMKNIGLLVLGAEDEMVETRSS